MHYAAWAEHACIDAAYEDVMHAGLASTISSHAHALNLQLPTADVERLTESLRAVTSTGAMPGAVTGLMAAHRSSSWISRPGVHVRMRSHLRRLSTHCDLEREIALVEEMWGRQWFAARGYPLPSAAEAVSDPNASRPSQGRDEGGMALRSLLEAGGALRDAGRWQDGAAPLSATADRSSSPMCPLRSRWRDSIEASGLLSEPLDSEDRSRSPTLQSMPAPADAQAATMARTDVPSVQRRAVVPDASPALAASVLAQYALPPGTSPDDPRPRASRERLAVRRAPAYFLIGSPRCGTSALHDELHRHPHVRPAAAKELNYVASTAFTMQSLTWYLSLFPRLPPGHISGDGSCTSLLCAVAADRVASIAATPFPDDSDPASSAFTPSRIAPPLTPTPTPTVHTALPRLILMVRDEVDRFASHYRMCATNHAAHGLRMPGVRATVRTELERASRCDATMGPHTPLATRLESCYAAQSSVCAFPSPLLPLPAVTAASASGRFPGCHHLLPFGMYAAGLQQWLRRGRFASHGVLVVQMDALRTHRDRVRHALHRFLDLPPVMTEEDAAHATARRAVNGEALDEPSPASQGRANGTAEATGRAERSLPPRLLLPNETAALRAVYWPHRVHLRDLLQPGGEAGNASVVMLRSFLPSFPGHDQQLALGDAAKTLGRGSTNSRRCFELL